MLFEHSVGAIPVLRGVLQTRPSLPLGCLQSHSGPCGGILAATRSVGCTGRSRMEAASQELAEMGCNNITHLLL